MQFDSCFCLKHCWTSCSGDTYTHQCHNGFSCDCTGSPLLYFYGRGYWITNRASLALATLADEREGKLKRENAALQSRLQQIQQQHLQAVELLVSTAMCCAVLCCAALRCAALRCAVLRCAALCCAGFSQLAYVCTLWWWCCCYIGADA